MDSLDPLAADLEIAHLVRADPALLDQGAAGDHDEEFPFGVVPVLPLGGAGPGDVHAELAAVFGAQQLREAAPGIAFHLREKAGLFFGKVAQIGGIELFGEGIMGHFRHHQTSGLIPEAVQKGGDLPQGDGVGGGDDAERPLPVGLPPVNGEVVCLCAKRPCIQQNIRNISMLNRLIIR